MSDLPVVPDGVAEIDLVGVRKGAFGSQGSGDTSGFGGLVAPIVMPVHQSRRSEAGMTRSPKS